MGNVQSTVIMHMLEPGPGSFRVVPGSWVSCWLLNSSGYMAMALLSCPEWLSYVPLGVSLGGHVGGGERPPLLAPLATVPSAVSSLTDDLLKYYQQVTRAVLGDDPQLMKVSEGSFSFVHSSVYLRQGLILLCDLG